MIGAVLTALALQTPLTQPSERFGWIIASGKDTVAVESVTREGAMAHSRVMIPHRARLEVDVVIDSEGCVTGATVASFPWGSTQGGTPQQVVSVRLDGDGVVVEVRAGDATQSFSRAFPGARAIIPRESDALSTPLLAECALSGGTDSATFSAVAFPNLRAMDVTVVRRGSEAEVVAEDTIRAVLDERGQVARMTAGGGLFVLTRVSGEEVSSLRFGEVDYAAPPGAPYTAEEIRFASEGGVILAGTLTVPSARTGPVPALVTVSGTGPQERDSYAPVADGWRPFRQIADTLGRAGYAVLRFDDRGVGASTGDQGTATERTAAADVLAAVRYLSGRGEVDGGRIVLLGHSEGVRVAMLAATELPELAGMVLLSGAADTRAAIRAQTRWLLEHGPQAGAVSPDSLEGVLDRIMDAQAASERREVFRWDARGVAERIRVPAVAVFHGENDRQVPSEEAGALAAVFEQTGERQVTIQVFPGLNHLLLPDVSGDFTRYDALPSGRVAAPVLAALCDWLAVLR